MLKVIAEPGLLVASWLDTVIEAILPATSFVLAAKVTVRTVAVEAEVQVVARSAPSLVQRTVGVWALVNMAALAVMVTLPAAGTSVVGVNQITAFPPAVDAFTLLILAAPPHVTDVDWATAKVIANTTSAKRPFICDVTLKRCFRVPRTLR